MDKELHELALWAKRKEIESAKEMRQVGSKGDTRTYSYWDGKMIAFSQIWEKIVFDGRSVAAHTVHPEEYNKAALYWEGMVQANP